MKKSSHALNRLRNLAALIFRNNKSASNLQFAYPAGTHRQSAMPLLEQLEPRVMLTAYTVNTLADTVAADGVISLREAIMAANDDIAVGDAPAGSGAELDLIIFDQDALMAEALAADPNWIDADGLIITLNGTQLEITGDIEIQGLDKDLLFINGNNQSGVFYLNSDTVKIADLSVTGGNATLGGGICTGQWANSIYLTDVNVCNNTATNNGSGIYNQLSQLYMTNVTVEFNTAGGSGGGIYVLGGDAYIKNSLIIRNSGYDGGGIWSSVSSGIEITNSTIASNSAVNDGGGLMCNAGATLKNTVVALNSAGSSYNDTPLTYTFNNCFIGSEDGDPKFVDAGQLNYRLASGSTLINAGNNTYAAGLEIDIEWITRIIDGTVDIGAYEYHVNPEVTAVNFDDASPAFGQDFKITAQVTEGSTTIKEVRFYYDTNGNGILDYSDLLLGSDFDGSDGWSITYTASEDFEPGNNQILAFAGDNNDAESQIKTAQITVEGQKIEIPENGKASYIDADGDTVTVSIKGGGNGYILLGGDTGNAVGIFLEGTTAKTALTFAVKTDKVNGGTGYTTIGGLQTDGLMKKINGKKVNLEGDIVLNVDLDTPGAKDSVAITLANVQDSSIDTNEMAILSLKLAAWRDSDEFQDMIQTLLMGSISVTGEKVPGVDYSMSGNFQAHITTSGVDGKGYAIKKITSKGEWSGDIKTNGGYIGAITVGSWAADLAAEYLKSLVTKSVNGREDANGDAQGKITISGTDAKGMAINNVNINGSADGLTIDAGNGAISSVAVTQWAVGELEAGVVKSLVTKRNKSRTDLNGEFGAAVTLNATWYNLTFNPRQNALNTANFTGEAYNTMNITGNVGTVKVSGEANSLDWDITGNVKSMTFGGLFGSDINVQGTLSSVAVTGWALPDGTTPDILTGGSLISANYINSASMKNWDTNDMTQLRVPTAYQYEDKSGNVAKLTYKDTTDKSNNFTWKPGQEAPWDSALEPIIYYSVRD